MEKFQLELQETTATFAANSSKDNSTSSVQTDPELTLKNDPAQGEEFCALAKNSLDTDVDPCAPVNAQQAAGASADSTQNNSRGRGGTLRALFRGAMVCGALHVAAVYQLVVTRPEAMIAGELGYYDSLQLLADDVWSAMAP